MKKKLLKAASVLTALVVLAAALPSGASGFSGRAGGPVRFGVMSDIHYYPESFVNLRSQKYLEAAYSEAKFMGESAAVLRASLETIAARKASGAYPMDYLLVPGDMTFSGEITGHLEVAALFRAFEARTGIQVYVINGNHDVNNYNAVNYALSDDDDPALITPPETFREIYADFGYAQADSVFTPSAGKAGMLSYAVSLPGGIRLIAVDACKYSADVTKDGLDKKEGGMHLSPELSAWVLGQARAAAARGETVLGMVHFSLLTHFELQAYLTAGDDMLDNYEGFACQLADAGMRFAFTGHVHANDTAGIVSAENHTLFDIETAALAGIPNIYREATLSPAAGGATECRLNNVACDAESFVDVGAVSDRYGVIERPFSENYAWPMLLGGCVEDGIRSDAAVFFDTMFLPEVLSEIRKALPGGLSALLKEQGLDPGRVMTNASPALMKSLAGFHLSAQDFSAFLAAVIQQIDERYILNTEHTGQLLGAAVARLTRYELAQGNSAAQLGKILLLCFEYHMTGDENPADHPEIQAAVDALRTQAGADALVAEVVDTVVNDMLFDDILPSINLNDLDKLLPPKVISALRAAAGGSFNAGAVLDNILNAAAACMNRNPFLRVDSGRDLVKALVYTAGYRYLNAGARLKMAGALADIIVSFTTDSDPVFLGDSKAVLLAGTAQTVPSAENFRLPADITAVKGAAAGEAVIAWYTMQGIEGSELLLSPLPAGAHISAQTAIDKKTVKTFDFGFTDIEVRRTLLKHTVTVSGLTAGASYTFSAGDAARGLMSAQQTLTLDANGDVRFNKGGGNDFYARLLDFFSTAANVLVSLRTVVMFLV